MLIRRARAVRDGSVFASKTYSPSPSPHRNKPAPTSPSRSQNVCTVENTLHQFGSKAGRRVKIISELRLVDLKDVVYLILPPRALIFEALIDLPSIMKDYISQFRQFGKCFSLFDVKLQN
jgi:hypothetical protein